MPQTRRARQQDADASLGGSPLQALPSKTRQKICRLPARAVAEDRGWVHIQSIQSSCQSRTVLQGLQWIESLLAWLLLPPSGPQAHAKYSYVCTKCDVLLSSSCWRRTNKCKQHEQCGKASLDDGCAIIPFARCYTLCQSRMMQHEGVDPQRKHGTTIGSSEQTSKQAHVLIACRCFIAPCIACNFHCDQRHIRNGHQTMGT